MYNSSQSIEYRIKELIKNELSLNDTIKNETNLYHDLGADSLDLVEMLMALEDEFRMEIPDEVAEKWHTVQNVIDSATELLAK